ncbi:MAG: fasciclin domain-containing protein [Prevotella sp.]|nr:fasciclin domain-containing protein [Prevotella sp.]
MKTKIHQIICAVAIVLGFTACVDNDSDVPENRYSSTKVTAAGFLEQNEDKLSDFITMLKRTPYFALLSTYGDFTVFAPNNEAFDKFMQTHGYPTIEAIPQPVCDTLARTHIIKGEKAYFTTDISEGTIQEMSMADTYIELSVDIDEANNNALIHYANKTARIVQFDDSVTNGVVHIVSSMIPRTSDKLPDIIALDSTVTIFSQALFLTGMADSLMAYIDETYPEWGADKTSQDSIYTDNIKVACLSGDLTEVPARWPEKRLFKFTAFIEPDSVYKRYGINNLDDLIAYTKKIYDDSYPEDAGLYDDDFKNRKNPLNRFVSYHLFDRIMPYSDIIMSQDFFSSHWEKKKADPEEIYETLSPGGIVRFCTVGNDNELYMNRKGLNTNYSIRGVRVMKAQDSGTSLQQALNGMYHYIDDILAFSKEVREDVLNCRLRFDANVLSPDFQNSGARGRVGVQKIIAFRPGFIKNWTVMGEAAFVGLHGDGPWWSSYKGNAMNINGIFDVTFKLPPVPKSGTYEIRTGYTVGNERGVVQFYLNGVPCDIPVDLRIYGGDPTIGWVADASDETTEDKNLNKAIDKAMRNHGYMKGMDTWYQGGDKANSLRSHSHNLRKILATVYLDANQTYYLRARQVLKDRRCYWNFDYLELCPKSVYDSPQGEDQH